MWNVRKYVCVIVQKGGQMTYINAFKKTEKADIPFQLTKETQTIRVNGSLKKMYKNNVLCHGS